MKKGHHTLDAQALVTEAYLCRDCRNGHRVGTGGLAKSYVGEGVDISPSVANTQCSCMLAVSQAPGLQSKSYGMLCPHSRHLVIAICQM